MTEFVVTAFGEREHCGSIVRRVLCLVPVDQTTGLYVKTITDSVERFMCRHFEQLVPTSWDVLKTCNSRNLFVHKLHEVGSVFFFIVVI